MRGPLGFPGRLAVVAFVQQEDRQPSPLIPILVVPIRVDLSNVRELTSPIAEALGAGAIHVVLDFSVTEAVDSTALGALVQIHKKVQAAQGQLVLFGVGDSVRRVLALTRLDSVFKLASNRSEALSLLSR
ncbi:MAG: hypothetical protein RJA70_1685 [Pseudomonadota bacterium]|jgi:anti-sigma B factor antagonist